MSEQNTSIKEFKSFIIIKERLIKEYEKSLHIKLNDQKRFFFPKKLTQLLGKDLKKVDNFDQAKYIKLSYPISGDFKEIKISEYIGKNAQDESQYKEEVINLDELKEIFVDETNEIFNKYKELSDQNSGISSDDDVIM